MKIHFIYNGAESLGIESLSAFLKSEGHTTALWFDPAVFSGDQLLNIRFLARWTNVDDRIVDRVVQEKPGLVAFSCFTGNYRWCLSIAERIKKRLQVPVVFGGVHPTAVTLEVLANSCVDYVVRGEGEHALSELVRYLEGDRSLGLADIRNLGYREGGRPLLNELRDYIRDLDSLPFPDKELFYDKIPLLAANYMIMTSRGCPFSCTYCSNNMYHCAYAHEKQHLRRRSPAHVIAELKVAKSKWHPELINFNDDVFTSSREWLQQFIPMYRLEIGLPFCCHVHPNAVTPEIAALLKEGGGWLVAMGIQSGSERIRKEVFNRAGSNERIAASVQYIKSAGMTISVDHIFGAPGETVPDLEASLELYNRIKPDRILTFWLTYYPGTEIINHAVQRNELSQEDISRIKQGYTGFTHGGGSVAEEKQSLYNRYAVLFQLRSLVGSDRIYDVVAGIVVHLPLKGLVTRFIMLLNAFKNRDVKVFYLIRYIWAKKRIP